MMRTNFNSIYPFLVVTAFVGLYYGILVQVADRLTLRIALRLTALRRVSVREIDSMTNLASAGVFQVLCCVTMASLLGVRFRPLLIDHFHWRYLAYGVALGLAEFPLSSLVIMLTVNTLAKVGPADVRMQLRGWSSMSRGGWVRFFQDVPRIAPWGLGHAAVWTYIGVEEIMFRGVIVSALARVSPESAVWFSTLLFAAIQATGMPSSLHALCPVLGAAVLGTIHSLLAIHVSNIVPLVIAHCVLFEVVALRSPVEGGDTLKLGGSRL